MKGGEPPGKLKKKQELVEGLVIENHIDDFMEQISLDTL